MRVTIIMNRKKILNQLILVVILAAGLFAGCKKKDNPLAPYTDSPTLSTVIVEQGTFKPRLTWVGGYVSVVGINRGPRAALDSTLVWLVYQAGNNIHFPVVYGTLPAGAQDLTTQYGGKTLDSLNEDVEYTYWVLKEDAWSGLSAASGKTILVDPSLASSSVKVVADSVKISSKSLTKKTENIDVYVNISDVSVYGQLADITVIQPRTSNNPVIKWTITQDGVTDTLVSAMGITEGNQYNENAIRWEVWSEEPGTNGKMIYGKKNLMASPVIMGQSFPGTKVFNAYPSAGLQRNKDYYFWIANRNWDAEGRLLFTPNYGYVIFHTW